MFDFSLHTLAERASCHAPFIFCTSSGRFNPVSCLESGGAVHDGSGLFFTVRESFFPLSGKVFFVHEHKLHKVVSMVITATGSKSSICSIRKCLSVVISAGNILRKTIRSIRRHIEKVYFRHSFATVFQG